MPRKGTKYTQIHLSAEAYSGLQDLAEMHHYARTNTISRVINDLAAKSTRFYDARPPHIKDTDNDHPNNPRIWNKQELETRGPKWLGELPNNFLLALADEHGIYPYQIQRPTILGQRQNPMWRHALQNYSISSRIGPVLEAIGLGWLKPHLTAASLIAAPTARRRLKRRLVGI